MLLDLMLAWLHEASSRFLRVLKFLLTLQPLSLSRSSKSPQFDMTTGSAVQLTLFKRLWKLIKNEEELRTLFSADILASDRLGSGPNGENMRHVMCANLNSSGGSVVKHCKTSDLLACSKVSNYTPLGKAVYYLMHLHHSAIS